MIKYVVDYPLIYKNVLIFYREDKMISK